MHRRYKIDCTWTPELAYVVGVFASDGNLSPDGRHLNVTSKDKEMAETVRTILRINNKIGRKARGGSKEKRYFSLQFGDINFYEFLLDIGLTPAKSKTLGPLAVPDEYFADFFRGCIDGDGSIDSFTHPESKLPQFRIRLCSASPRFTDWALSRARILFDISGGWIYRHERSGICMLSFAKKDALKIIKSMYYADTVPALERKRAVALTFLGE